MTPKEVIKKFEEWYDSTWKNRHSKTTMMIASMLDEITRLNRLMKAYLDGVISTNDFLIGVDPWEEDDRKRVGKCDTET
jgi:hypothetical protein